MQFKNKILMIKGNHQADDVCQVKKMELEGREALKIGITLR